MKKVGMIICAIAAAAMSVTAMAEGNWQSQVVKASQDAAVLKQTMKGMSNADQLAFVKAVNAAIASKAGSAEEKADLFVTAMRAALESANADNRAAVIAETFATVPTESLTAVSEALSKDLKAAGGDQTKLANDVMDAVVKRSASADNAGARETFAALAFIRNDSNLTDSLVAKLDADTQEIAKNEWIKPALAGNYDPILGATNADEAPELANVNSLALPDSASAAILGSMGATSSGALTGGELFGGEDGTLEAQGHIGLQARPITADPGSPGAGKFGTVVVDPETGKQRVIIDPTGKRGRPTPYHPGGYQNQTT